MMNDLPVVTIMAEHGADIGMSYNPADKLPDPVLSKAEARKNQSILHIAAGSGANYVVEYLASRGAALQTKNDHGETALDLADQQERFRYNHDLETQAADRVGGSKAVAIERDSSTTDAFRRALGGKSKLASN
jgi:ankyrin repeat protein